MLQKQSIPLDDGDTDLPDELLTLLSMLDDSVMFVDRNTMVVRWLTEGCQQFGDLLGIGCSITDIDGLDQLCHLIDNESSDVRVRMKWETLHPSSGEPLVVDVAVRSVTGKSSMLCLVLNDAERKGNYIKTYLADREELFTTSRSLTVGEMATTVAHELNQPIGTMMNIVRGVRSRLNRDMWDKPEVMEALSLAEKQGQFAADILSRIRDFTQSRQPEIDLCDISQLLVETVNLLDWVFEGEKVNLEIDLSGDQLLVDGDRTLLQQVFVNLLRNAVESMDGIPVTNRQLKVNAMVVGQYISVNITDSGHGLSGVAEQRLFKPFESSKPNGMGVGLNICRSFIELHKGRFWLSNNIDAPGCTAHLRFPCVQ